MGQGESRVPERACLCLIATYIAAAWAALGGAKSE